VNCHETIDLMDQSLEDALPADARAGFAEHLDECPPCRVYLAQLTEAVRSLARLATPGRPHPGRDDLVRQFREQVKRNLN
jgi:anti-sigma factor RsiW